MTVGLTKQPNANPKKRLGQYYTPEPLVRLLLDAALDPAIAAAPDPSRLKICDPACGSGHFLVPAAERLASALAASDGMSRTAALRHVVTHQIFGADVDEVAIRDCIARLAGLAEMPAESIAPNVRVGDALQDAFAADASFDVILGNPPYVNAIEGNVSDNAKSRLRGRFPTVRGAADLSHYFLARAVELVANGGRIGLILPRGILNAPGCAGLRASLPPLLRPNVLYAPEHCDWFEGAAVFASAVVLGPDESCRVSTATDPDQPNWSTGRIESENWWREARRILGHVSDNAARAGRRVEDVFQVIGSLTTGDAYDLNAAIKDSKRDVGPKLITTGLIDPSECLWGNRRCRYLGRDYANPRVNSSAKMSRSLSRRVDQSRRPKVLVAGLTRRVECFFDPGQCLGAVSTFSVFHPADNHDALLKLCDYLSSNAVTRQFVAELGGNGMRGGHVTMKKTFLRSLPLPDGWA